jgi:SMI1 / KNR4 family (SUKH-1)
MPFPTTEHFVRRAEAELDCKLPREYHAWALTNNGGELSAANDSWEVFPVFDDSDRKRAARSANHIIRETVMARRWHGFPPEGVPFAANGRGDLLIFLPREHDATELAPEVYIWHHEKRTCDSIASSLSELSSEL